MTDQTPIQTDAATITGILPAIASAMGDVQKVSKGDRNKHDGYDFASIDNFLSLVNPICARHGLIILSDEVAREDFTRAGRNGESPWMRVSFSFTVHHVSGQSLPSMTRSVEVMRNGAQAYGSAQSYCLKQFLRGLFLIPTGDKDDADFERKDEGQIVTPRRQPDPPAFDPRAAADRIITAIRKREGDKDALSELWTTEKPVLAELPEPMFAEVKAEFSKAAPKAPAPSAEIQPAEIPY